MYQCLSNKSMNRSCIHFYMMIDDLCIRLCIIKMIENYSRLRLFLTHVHCYCYVRTSSLAAEMDTAWTCLDS